MCSVMGRNVQYYCECFDVCSTEVINSSGGDSGQWKLVVDEDRSLGPKWFRSWSSLGMVYCVCLGMFSHIRSPLPPLGHILDLMLVWRKGKIKRAVSMLQCCTVL